MINLNPEQLLFFDIETYKEDCFVVFKNIDKETVAFFHNDFSELWETIKDKTLVGFNNYWYDDIMLTYMLKCYSPAQLKKVNDRIIKGERLNPDMRLKTLDVFQQISVSRPSLKKIEGNMGKSIIETSVGFDIDRALTPSELEEEMEYCKYDVDMVIEIWHMRQKGYFQPKKVLLKRFNKPMAKKWNTTTISANLLLDRPMVKWSALRVKEEILDLVPLEVKDLWLQANDIGAVPKKKSKTVNEFGNKIVFGFGGLHGVKTHGKRFENVLLADVTGFYPQMIINLNVLGAGTKQYKDMYGERVRIKATHPIEQEALKLVLNSVYGQLNSQYSMLHNTRALYSVCIYGQAILYELAKRMSMSSDILQLNTDGIMFQSTNEAYRSICKNWEDEFNMNLEFETIDLLLQRDVNNYIAVEFDKTRIDKDGNEYKQDIITVKGGDVRKYHQDFLFDNNNLRILDIAIVDYLVYGKDVIETLQDNLNNPKLFQYILQAGRTYEGTFDMAGKQYNRVNRVFACKDNVEQKTTLYKKRKDGGMDRFPNSSDNMIVWNDDVKDFKDFEKVVDINWYYQLIQEKLKAWTDK